MTSTISRRTLALAAVPALVAAVAAFAGAAEAGPAADLCVGGKPGCYASIQAAVDAAQDGDTIKIGPGTFPGGITIAKDVTLVGTSAGATTIEGGGPVVTIGDGTADLTVSISRVTITGGFNRSVPDSFFPSGGGVLIPPASDGTTGAAVTISDSVIARNRTAPEPDEPKAGCPCAFGAGINNAGTLTVTNTRISDNVVGSTAADSSAAVYAAGGGIFNAAQATLTVRRSVVSGNRAAVSPPNGYNTDGGGIVSYGALTVEDSVVRDNRSEVEASAPSSFLSDHFTEANAGGLYLAPRSSTTISRSRISGNGVHSTNTAGDASAEAAGIDAEGTLLLTDCAVQSNSAAAIVPSMSGFLAETDGGGMQVRGTGTVRTVRRCLITKNSLTSTSESGQVLASGAGIASISGNLTLERTVVAANSATAIGVGGFEFGGGIANVLVDPDPRTPAPVLMLSDTVITANTLTASDGVLSQGGGLYTKNPFTGDPFSVAMTHTVIAGNKPDQCVGC